MTFYSNVYRFGLECMHKCSSDTILSRPKKTAVTEVTCLPQAICNRRPNQLINRETPVNETVVSLFQSLTKVLAIDVPRYFKKSAYKYLTLPRP